MLIVELKSEALKERHWKQLMRKLSVKWVLSDLVLGQIWDCNLQKNEPIIKDVINVAQGEMALEEFLKQVCSRFYFLSKYTFFLPIVLTGLMIRILAVHIHIKYDDTNFHGYEVPARVNIHTV